MRSPRSARARAFPRGAVSLSTLLCLSLVGTVPALGANHEEGQTTPVQGEATRIIVIEPVDHVMLVDGKRRLDASICEADGSGCKDAKKAKWSVKPKKGLKLSARKGPQSLVEGKKAGLYEITVKQGDAVGSTTVTINEPSDRTRQDAAQPADDRRLYLVPQEADVAIGEEFVVTAWGCPLANGRVGDDGVANGVDDECTTEPLVEVNPDAIEDLELLGAVGPSALLRLTAFPGPADGGPTWFGVQANTALGGTLVDRFAQNAPFEGTRLGDTDGDGLRGASDVAALFPDGVDVYAAPLTGEALTDELRALDLNGDGVIDETDAGLFGLLETADGVEPSGSLGAPDGSSATGAAGAGADLDLETIALALSDPGAVLLGEPGLIVEVVNGRLEGGEPGSGDLDRNGLVDQVDGDFARATFDVVEAGVASAENVYDPVADMDGDVAFTWDDVLAIRALSR